MNLLYDFLKKNKDKTYYTEYETKTLLIKFGLNVPKGIFVAQGKQVPSPLALAYPLIAKVSSQWIPSKSDINGIRPGLRDEKELMDAVADLERIDKAEGVLIEEMAPLGLEVVVGGLIDSQFGPVVMFGIGGIFVELFKDVAFGLAPVNRAGAAMLLRQVKGYRLLEGYRGMPAADTDALITVIAAVSEIIATGLIEEITLNPVALYAAGALVLDAKMSAAPLA